jgi:hypothetical protein
MPPPTRALAGLATDLRDEVYAFPGTEHGDERERRERMQVALDICLYAGADID